MPPQDESPLERLRTKLYEPNASFDVARDEQTTPVRQGPESWQHPAALRPKKRISFSTLFLVLAVGFFVVAGGAAATILYLGGRTVSADHLAVSASGPTTVAGGDTVPLLITIENDNPVAATNAMLSIDFPSGTLSADDGSQLAHHTESLGDIPAGASVERTIRAKFYGSQNATLAVPITVDYHTAQSNAHFEKKYEYDFTITSSPVSLDVSSVTSLSSGQALTLSIDVRSNATTPLSNIAVKPNYPPGFVVSSTSLQLSSGVFQIGMLAPGESKHLTVSGTLAGAEGDQRVFHFTAGTLSSVNGNTFSVSYMTSDTTITLEKPFLALTLSVGGSTADAIVAQPGASLPVTLSWSNPLTTSIQNAKITVALTGNALDPGSVNTSNGFYSSSNSTVSFTSQTSSSLKNLSPGDSGQGSFTFAALPPSASTSLHSPVVTLTVSASGTRASDSGVPQDITSTIVRTVKFTSALSLSMTSARTKGGLTNTGPWPPVVNQKTTYTILLSATNSANTVANGTASMTLPSSVSYTGATTGTGIFAYDDATRTVTWSLGDMSPSTQYSGAFQVSLLPSTSQKGTSPVLVSSGTLSGVDRFAQAPVSASASAVTIQTTSDPGYTTADGTVH